MKIRFATTACLGLLVLATAPAQSGLDLRNAIAKTAPAVVAVESPLVGGTVAGNRTWFVPGLAEDRGGRWLETLNQKLGKHRAGFFVAPDLVLVHRNSISGETTKIITPDGSRYSANRVVSDHVTGLVLVRVDHGADATIALRTEPIEVGLPVIVQHLRDGKTPVARSSTIASYPDSYRSRIGFGFCINTQYRPGAQGAPVVDGDGALVGVVSGEADGMMFCLPVAHLLGRLVAGADNNMPTVLQAGRIGVAVDGNSVAGAGVKVTDVNPDSTAEQAGITTGDRIVSINRQHACRDARDLLAAISMFRAGDEVTVQLKRDDEELEVTVQLNPAPDPHPVGSPLSQIDGNLTQSIEIPGIGNWFDLQKGDHLRLKQPIELDLDFDNLQIERSALEETVRQLEEQVGRLKEQIRANRQE